MDTSAIDITMHSVIIYIVMKSVETIRVELTNDIDTSWFSDVSTMFASAYGENYRGDDSLRRKILEGDIFLGIAMGGDKCGSCC